MIKKDYNNEIYSPAMQSFTKTSIDFLALQRSPPFNLVKKNL